MDPRPPTNHYGPLKIAEDTYLIQHLQGEGEGPFAVYLHSLVILGSEPIIVDTGGANNRDRWIDDVCSLVDPEDVRWIFLSHDDPDHTGNLRKALEICPNATLITNWFTVERMSCELALPPKRMRWVNDGESFEANGRIYAAVRPPIFDSPTTRGLFDPKTGVYWASDCFATPVAAHVENVADLDPTFWREGFLMFHRAVAPWHLMLDQGKFDRAVHQVEKLGARVLASAHTPVISGEQVGRAFDLTHLLPSLEAVILPGQAELDSIIAATMEDEDAEEENVA